MVQFTDAVCYSMREKSDRRIHNEGKQGRLKGIQDIPCCQHANLSLIMRLWFSLIDDGKQISRILVAMVYTVQVHVS